MMTPNVSKPEALSSSAALLLSPSGSSGSGRMEGAFAEQLRSQQRDAGRVREHEREREPGRGTDDVRSPADPARDPGRQATAASQADGTHDTDEAAQTDDAGEDSQQGTHGARGRRRTSRPATTASDTTQNPGIDPLAANAGMKLDTRLASARSEPDDGTDRRRSRTMGSDPLPVDSQTEASALAMATNAQNLATARQSADADASAADGPGPVSRRGGRAGAGPGSSSAAADASAAGRGATSASEALGDAIAGLARGSADQDASDPRQRGGSRGRSMIDPQGSSTDAASLTQTLGSADGRAASAGSLDFRARFLETSARMLEASGLAPSAAAGFVLPPPTAAPGLSMVPTATLAPAVNDPAFAQAMTQQISLMISDQISEADLIVHPPDMGPIRVEMKVRGDDAQLVFTAAHPQTRHAIEQSADVLRSMLAERGLSLAQMDVGQGHSQGFAGAQADASASRQQSSGNGGSSAGWGGQGDSTQAGHVHRSASTARPRGLIDLFA